MRVAIDDRSKIQTVGDLEERFNYDELPSLVAKFLRGQADRIRRQTTSSIIQIGKALLESKRHLSHGAFIRWVEWEVCIPARTAQGYMRVANWASGKSATVAHLSPAVLYVLSAPWVPKEYLAAILKRAEAGEHVTPAIIRTELKACRSNKSENCAAEKAASSETSENILWEPFSITNQTRSDVAELSEILSRGLSDDDLARVLEIIIKENVLSDPHWSQCFREAFIRAAGLVPHVRRSGEPQRIDR
jgi:hypothetical protein